MAWPGHLGSSAPQTVPYTLYRYIYVYMYIIRICIGMDNLRGFLSLFSYVPIPGIFHFFGGIGTGIGTNWYRKKSRNRYWKNLVLEKVSEPGSENFYTGTDFRRNNLGILKIYNGYRYRDFFIFFGGIGTGTAQIWYRKKSLGIGKIWYRKKVSEPLSEKIGTEKSTGFGNENVWYRKKVSVSVWFKILGTVTH